jgi:hypothetical protein
MTAQLLNQMELSDRWSISERTLEAWRWRRKGPKFLRIGGRIRYRIEDVVAFEVSRERDPTAEDLRVKAKDRDKSQVMS